MLLALSVCASEANALYQQSTPLADCFAALIDADQKGCKAPAPGGERRMIPWGRELSTSTGSKSAMSFLGIKIPLALFWMWHIVFSLLLHDAMKASRLWKAVDYRIRSIDHRSETANMPVIPLLARHYLVNQLKAGIQAQERCQRPVCASNYQL